MRYGKFLFLSLLGVFLWGLQSCTRPPNYSPIPEVNFVSFSKDTIRQGAESVELAISFTDGDGDIGSDKAQQNNVMVIDTRRRDTTFYQVPVIPKQGVADGIAGEIYLTLSDVCCIRQLSPPILCAPIPQTFQEVTFEVLLRDEAGNWSNTSTSAPLRIQCF